MRRNKKYMNGQPRGGVPGVCVDSSQKDGRAKKDYLRLAIAAHGGDLAYDAFVKGGRRGYGR